MKKLISYLTGASRRSEKSMKQFRQLLLTAEAIAENNPRGLADLVHAIIRPYQSEALLAVAEQGTDANPTIEISSIFGKEVVNRFYAEGYMRGREISSDRFRLQLGRHAVLPWPWKHERYVNNVARIGTTKIDQTDPWGRRHAGPWRQDINHSVTLWLPWGIATVSGGNHSITAGILAGEGEIVPRSVYDMSSVFDHVHTDGATWFDTLSNEEIEEVKDPRFAALFEIGRLMMRVEFPAFQAETHWLDPSSGTEFHSEIVASHTG